MRLSAVPGAAVLVVRGDALEPSVLRADALRFMRRYPAWGRYGVSAFFAGDREEVEALCETKLQRFATVVIFRREDLLAAGVDVVPTFRAPHVTLAAPSLTSWSSASCRAHMRPWPTRATKGPPRAR
ncbi:MAG: hypothetical protein ACRDZX_17775 [Acidimicrobiales bacterium]